MIKYSKEYAVKEVMRYAEDSYCRCDDYAIYDATPLDIELYLQDLGFEEIGVDYDSPFDEVFCHYHKDGIMIVIVFNGWVQYVGIYGYHTDTYKNLDTE